MKKKIMHRWLNKKVSLLLFALVFLLSSMMFHGAVFGASDQKPGNFQLYHDETKCDTNAPEGPAIRIHWNHSDGVEAYHIYRNESYYVKVNLDETFYNSANLIAGNLYTYRVVAENSNGTTNSNTISVYVPDDVCDSSPEPQCSDFNFNEITTIEEARSLIYEKCSNNNLRIVGAVVQEVNSDHINIKTYRAGEGTTLIVEEKRINITSDTLVFEIMMSFRDFGWLDHTVTKKTVASLKKGDHIIIECEEDKSMKDAEEFIAIMITKDVFLEEEFGLQAVYHPETQNVALQWYWNDLLGEIDGFKIYREISDGAIQEIGTTNNSYYSDNDVPVNMWITYYIKAYLDENESYYSEPAMVYTSETVGEAPREFDVFLDEIYCDANKPAVKISWESSVNVSNYHVCKCDSINSAFGFYENVSNTTLSFTDKANLIAGNTYYYSIRAFNEFGETISDNFVEAEILEDVCGTPVLPQCSDGIDNDGDGFVDENDAGCLNPSDTSENSDQIDILKKELVDSLEKLSEQYSKKIDMDLSYIANSFAAVRDYRRAAVWTDIFSPILSSIEMGLSSISSVSKYFSGVSVSGVEKLMDFSQFALLTSSWKEAVDDLERGVFGLHYTEAQESLLKHAEDRAVSGWRNQNFDQAEYSSVIYDELRSPSSETRNMLMIPRLTPTSTRTHGVPFYGVAEIEYAGVSLIKELVNSIKGDNENLDVETLESIILHVNHMIKVFQRNDGEYAEYKTYLAGESDSKYSILNQLGSISQYGKLNELATKNMADSLGIEIKTQAISVAGMVTTAVTLNVQANPLSFIISIGSLGAAANGSIQQSTTHIENRKAEDVFYEIPEYMLNSLPYELANAWMMLVDTTYTVEKSLDLKSGLLSSAYYGEIIHTATFSPTELVVIDEFGNRSGHINGVVFEEIPDSTVLGKNIFIKNPSEGLVYKLLGMEDGKYSWKATRKIAGIDKESVRIHEATVVVGQMNTIDVMWGDSGNTSFDVDVDIDNDGSTDHVIQIEEAEISDEVAPNTLLLVNDNEIINDWYTPNIELKLKAVDNKDGVGIQKTEYSLDLGITWQTYTDLFIISTYGNHTIQYRSEDWFGNIEETKTATFRIVTSRELLQDTQTRLEESESTNPIKQTLKQLKQALDDKYWEDNNLLSEIGGKNVPAHLRNTIRQLEGEDLGDIKSDIELALEILGMYNEENGNSSDIGNVSSGGSGFIANAIIENSIHTSKINKDSVLINWRTSQFATSKIVFSNEFEGHIFDVNNFLNYGYADAVDGGLLKVTGHELELTGLQPDTTYYYRCISAYFPEIISQEHSFTTKGKKEKVVVLGINTDYRAIQLEQIIIDASNTWKGNVDSVVISLGIKRDLIKEREVVDKYMLPLIDGINSLAIKNKHAIINFITYGTETTEILGAGERTGVLNSYKSAFGKLPTTESEWQDLIKIANGRWSNERSETAEVNAKIEFKKVYKREADMENPNDNAAITIIAYGLRFDLRNLDSEKAGIKSFKYIYGYNPFSAIDWGIVRAIAYSGATQ